MRRSPLDKFTILTVCSGNICRSPVAEQLLRAGLLGIPGIVVESAGTIASDGDRMPPQAEALSVAYGADPRDHRARYLVENHASGAQLIFAMAREHRKAIVTLWPRATRSTFTIREFGRLSAGITPADLTEIAKMATDDAPARLRAVVALVAAQRGQVAGADRPEDDDVIDPYRRDDATFALSGQQLVPPTETAVRLLRLAATIVPG
ncbi:MAG: low molecular weight phosphatase family protein [Microbacteriaceae bacterium]|nr:low molecular weight phosphatase family protein [Microbacteriaceae bacterium]